MGKALIFKGADFSANAIGQAPVPPTPVNWWYGLTSADMTPSTNGGPIYYNQYTVLKDQNGTWLQGKTIQKLRIWIKDRNQATATISIGYLPAGWTAQTDFVAVKTLSKSELNMTLAVSTEAETERGKNDIDLNMTIPAGALFGVQCSGCYIMVAAGGNNGVVKDDYKNISSNGANYVGWTPGIDFAFAG